MAGNTYTVAANGHGAYAKTLASGDSNFDTVTFTDNTQSMVMVSDATAAIYFTVDGTAPTAGGATTLLLPAGVTGAKVRFPSGQKSVKLTSAGTPVYSVVDNNVDLIGGGGGGGSGGAVSGNVGITGIVTVDETARQTEAVTLLASAARTADPTIAEQTNEYAGGVVVSLKVTSAGTGSITMKLVGYHNADNSTYDLTTATTAITANGTYSIVIAPSAASAATTSVSTPGYLPRRWSVVITHGNANSMTYSLSAQLVGV